MTLPSRTQLELNTQAKHMLMECYERLAGVNLYGHCPMKSADPNYKKAKQICISRCDRYDDHELKAEFEINF